MSAAAKAASTVLVRNGLFVLADEDAKAFLLRAPRGAYTTMRSVQRNAVFNFTEHCTRTATSLVAMVREGTVEGPRGRDLDAEALRRVMLRELRATVHELLTRRPEMHGNKDDIKITQLVCVAQPPAQQVAASAPAAAAAGQAYEVAGWTLDVYTHLGPLPQLPPVVKAQVEFAHRVNAKAKDSEWVRQRLELEQRKRGADINDVIMMTDDGALLEGTSSNFYAIKKGVVYTANEGILIGTVRTRVLSVCEQMGIPVVLQPPRAAEIAQWEAAFISSTSRIVLPLSHLWLPAAVVAAGDKERLCEFATGPDTLVSRLAKRVFDSILADSEPVLAGAWV